MKVIIKESQSQKLLFDYFEENYGGLSSTHIEDIFGNEDKCSKKFYRNDSLDDDSVFRIYKKCWWKIDFENTRALEMYKKSPILTFDDESEYEKLNAYFGDIWRPLFKEWFEITYGEKIKTIEN